MRARRVFSVIDAHTEGMPVRVVTSGAGVIPGASMAERRTHFLEHMDELRELLMREPRGHSSMSGVILQPTATPGADVGVLFIETSGCLPMCGHGTIGTATVLVEAGMVEVRSPVTRITLEVPAGLVVAEVDVSEHGAATRVTIENVASYAHDLDAAVDVPGLGTLRYDLGYGGNYYAILPAQDVGVELRPENAGKLIALGRRITEAINAAGRPVHPERSDISGCKHVIFTAPGRNGASVHTATAIDPGFIDRSPCGTGTSAQVAVRVARGELELGQEFVNESLIGSHFTGVAARAATVGDRPAIVPRISGRAWVMGMGQLLLAADDPFPAGFVSPV